MTSKDRFSTALRTVSLFLAFTLALEPLAFASPIPARGVFAKDEKTRVDLPVSASVATVEDARLVAGQKTVYLLQDAHTNVSAQFNMATLLEALFKEEASLRTVFVEAGFGNDTLTAFKPFTPLADRKRNAAAFVRQGYLGGEEYLNLTSDIDFTIWGVEDKVLYDQAVENYRRTRGRREQLGRYLDSIELTLQTLDSRVLNPVLLSFDAKRRAYDAGKLPLTDYLNALETETSRLGLSGEKGGELAKLSALRASEKAIDFEAVRREQAQALLSLSEEDRKELAGHSPKMLQAKEEGENAYYARLEEKLAARRAQYPGLSAYLEYRKKARGLDLKKTIEQIAELESRVLDALTLNAEEKTFLDVRALAADWRKLFAFTMTPDEFNAYASRSGRVPPTEAVGFLNRKIKELGSHYERALFLEGGFEDVLKTAESFYGLTLKRDETFVKNVAEKMDEAGLEKSVLIAGGYHTANLKELLKARGISYVSIMPQVLHETNLKRYEEVLLGDAFAARPVMIRASAPKMTDTLHALNNPPFYAVSFAPTFAPGQDASALLASINGARLAERKSGPSRRRIVGLSIAAASAGLLKTFFEAQDKAGAPTEIFSHTYDSPWPLAFDDPRYALKIVPGNEVRIQLERAPSSEFAGDITIELTGQWSSKNEEETKNFVRKPDSNGSIRFALDDVKDHGHLYHVRVLAASGTQIKAFQIGPYDLLAGSGARLAESPSMAILPKVLAAFFVLTSFNAAQVSLFAQRNDRVIPEPAYRYATDRPIAARPESTRDGNAKFTVPNKTFSQLLDGEELIVTFEGGGMLAGDYVRYQLTGSQRGEDVELIGGATVVYEGQRYNSYPYIVIQEAGRGFMIDTVTLDGFPRGILTLKAAKLRGAESGRSVGSFGSTSRGPSPFDDRGTSPRDSGGAGSGRQALEESRAQGSSPFDRTDGRSSRRASPFDDDRGALPRDNGNAQLDRRVSDNRSAAPFERSQPVQRRDDRRSFEPQRRYIYETLINGRPFSENGQVRFDVFNAQPLRNGEELIVTFTNAQAGDAVSYEIRGTQNGQSVAFDNDATVESDGFGSSPRIRISEAGQGFAVQSITIHNLPPRVNPTAVKIGKLGGARLSEETTRRNLLGKAGAFFAGLVTSAKLRGQGEMPLDGGFPIPDYQIRAFRGMNTIFQRRFADPPSVDPSRRVKRFTMTINEGIGSSAVTPREGESIAILLHGARDLQRTLFYVDLGYEETGRRDFNSSVERPLRYVSFDNVPVRIIEGAPALILNVGRLPQRDFRKLEVATVGEPGYSTAWYVYRAAIGKITGATASNAGVSPSAGARLAMNEMSIIGLNVLVNTGLMTVALGLLGGLALAAFSETVQDALPFVRAILPAGSRRYGFSIVDLSGNKYIIQNTGSQTRSLSELLEFVAAEQGRAAMLPSEYYRVGAIEMTQGSVFEAPFDGKLDLLITPRQNVTVTLEEIQGARLADAVTPELVTKLIEWKKTQGNLPIVAGFLGEAGSGKGTQAKDFMDQTNALLDQLDSSRQYGRVVSLSTGDVFRAVSRIVKLWNDNGTHEIQLPDDLRLFEPYAKLVTAEDLIQMRKGGNASDKTVAQILSLIFSQPENLNAFMVILAGAPRTPAQLSLFDQGKIEVEGSPVGLDFTLILEVDNEATFEKTVDSIVERAQADWKTRGVIRDDARMKEEIVDGKPVRSVDVEQTREVARNRHATFLRDTKPVIELLRGRNDTILVPARIEGAATREEGIRLVRERILEQLDRIALEKSSPEMGPELPYADIRKAFYEHPALQLLFKEELRPADNTLRFSVWVPWTVRTDDEKQAVRDFKSESDVRSALEQIKNAAMSGYSRTSVLMTNLKFGEKGTFVYLDVLSSAIGPVETVVPVGERNVSESERFAVLALDKPAGETFPDLSPVARNAMLALHDSGRVGAGNKVSVDHEATVSLRHDLAKAAEAKQVRMHSVNAEGEKDYGEHIPGEHQVMLTQGEAFGRPGDERYEVSSDSVDGTSNAAAYKSGREGRVSSVVAVGRRMVPVADQLRALNVSFNDGGRGLSFDLAAHRGPGELEKAFVEFVKEYARKMDLRPDEVTIHLIGNSTFGQTSPKAHRHLLVYDLLKRDAALQGLKFDIFSAGTVTPQVLAGAVPGHIYFGMAGSTETIMASQALVRLASGGAKTYTMIASDNAYYEVVAADNRFLKYGSERTRRDLDNRFAFSAEDAHRIGHARSPEAAAPYYSEETQRRILNGEYVFSIENGNLPPVDLYQTLYLPTGYEFPIKGSAESVKDNGYTMDGNTIQISTIEIDRGGFFVRRETLTPKGGARLADKSSRMPFLDAETTLRLRNVVSDWLDPNLMGLMIVRGQDGEAGAILIQRISSMHVLNEDLPLYGNIQKIVPNVSLMMAPYGLDDPFNISTPMLIPLKGTGIMTSEGIDPSRPIYTIVQVVARTEAEDEWLRDAVEGVLARFTGGARLAATKEDLKLAAPYLSSDQKLAFASKAQQAVSAADLDQVEQEVIQALRMVANRKSGEKEFVASRSTIRSTVQDIQAIEAAIAEERAKSLRTLKSAEPYLTEPVVRHLTSVAAEDLPLANLSSRVEQEILNALKAVFISKVGRTDKGVVLNDSLYRLEDIESIDVALSVLKKITTEIQTDKNAYQVFGAKKDLASAADKTGIRKVRLADFSREVTWVENDAVSAKARYFRHDGIYYDLETGKQVQSNLNPIKTGWGKPALPANAAAKRKTAESAVKGISAIFDKTVAPDGRSVFIKFDVTRIGSDAPSTALVRVSDSRMIRLDTTGIVYNYFYSPNGKYLFVQDGPHAEYYDLYDVETGKNILELNKSNVLFSVDGNFLFSLHKGEATIYDLRIVRQNALSGARLAIADLPIQRREYKGQELAGLLKMLADEQKRQVRAGTQPSFNVQVEYTLTDGRSGKGAFAGFNGNALYVSVPAKNGVEIFAIDGIATERGTSGTISGLTPLNYSETADSAAYPFVNGARLAAAEKGDPLKVLFDARIRAYQEHIEEIFRGIDSSGMVRSQYENVSTGPSGGTSTGAVLNENRVILTYTKTFAPYDYGYNTYPMQRLAIKYTASASVEERKAALKHFFSRVLYSFEKNAAFFEGAAKSALRSVSDNAFDISNAGLVYQAANPSGQFQFEWDDLTSKISVFSNNQLLLEASIVPREPGFSQAALNAMAQRVSPSTGYSRLEGALQTALSGSGYEIVFKPYRGARLSDAPHSTPTGTYRLTLSDSQKPAAEPKRYGLHEGISLILWRVRNGKLELSITTSQRVFTSQRDFEAFSAYTALRGQQQTLPTSLDAVSPSFDFVGMGGSYSMPAGEWWVIGDNLRLEDNYRIKFIEQSGKEAVIEILAPGTPTPAVARLAAIPVPFIGNPRLQISNTVQEILSDPSADLQLVEALRETPLILVRTRLGIPSVARQTLNGGDLLTIQLAGNVAPLVGKTIDVQIRENGDEKAPALQDDLSVDAEGRLTLLVTRAVTPQVITLLYNADSAAEAKAVDASVQSISITPAQGSSVRTAAPAVENKTPLSNDQMLSDFMRRLLEVPERGFNIGGFFDRTTPNPFIDVRYADASLALPYQFVAPIAGGREILMTEIGFIRAAYDPESFGLDPARREEYIAALVRELFLIRKDAEASYKPGVVFGEILEAWRRSLQAPAGARLADRYQALKGDLNRRLEDAFSAANIRIPAGEFDRVKILRQYTEERRAKITNDIDEIQRRETARYTPSLAGPEVDINAAVAIIHAYPFVRENLRGLQDRRALEVARDMATNAQIGTIREREIAALKVLEPLLDVHFGWDSVKKAIQLADAGEAIQASLARLGARLAVTVGEVTTGMGDQVQRYFRATLTGGEGATTRINVALKADTQASDIQAEIRNLISQNSDLSLDEMKAAVETGLKQRFGWGARLAVAEQSAAERSRGLSPANLLMSVAVESKVLPDDVRVFLSAAVQSVRSDKEQILPLETVLHGPVTLFWLKGGQTPVARDAQGNHWLLDLESSRAIQEQSLLAKDLVKADDVQKVVDQIRSSSANLATAADLSIASAPYTAVVHVDAISPAGKMALADLVRKARTLGGENAHYVFVGQDASIALRLAQEAGLKNASGELTPDLAKLPTIVLTSADRVDSIRAQYPNARFTILPKMAEGSNISMVDFDATVRYIRLLSIQSLEPGRDFYNRWQGYDLGVGDFDQLVRGLSSQFAIRPIGQLLAEGARLAYTMLRAVGGSA